MNYKTNSKECLSFLEIKLDILFQESVILNNLIKDGYAEKRIPDAFSEKLRTMYALRFIRDNNLEALFEFFIEIPNREYLVKNWATIISNISQYTEMIWECTDKVIERDNADPEEISDVEYHFVNTAKLLLNAIQAEYIYNLEDIEDFLNIIAK